MKPIRHNLLWASLLWLLAGQASGQELDNEFLIEETLVENTTLEIGPMSLVIDASRTKIGRDFYEAFYQRWSNAATANAPTVSAPADSSQRNGVLPTVFNLAEYVITIEDLPLPGNGFTSNVSILIDDQLVWQQFVPARREVIEDYADYAAATVLAYFADLQAVQTQLGREDWQTDDMY